MLTFETTLRDGRVVRIMANTAYEAREKIMNYTEDVRAHISQRSYLTKNFNKINKIQIFNKINRLETKHFSPVL